MKEEIARIMKMVQDGKLSPEDAAELIDAMKEGAGQTPQAAQGEAGEPKKPSPGLKGLAEVFEGLGKDLSDSANWQQIGRQIKESVKKGLEQAKVHIEQVKKTGFFGSIESKEVQLHLPPIDGRVLKVEGYSGDIKISGGRQEGQVLARAMVRASDAEEAKRKLGEYTLIIEESDHAVIIKQPSISGLSVDLDVAIAGKAAVEAHTHSGDISIVDTGLSAKVSSHSGDIHIKNVEGLVEVNLNSGDVTLEDSKSSDISIENRTGDVTLRRTEGNVNVRTASGDVRVMACQGGTVSLESVTGDISVDVAAPIAKAFNVRTVNGDAAVTIPDGCDCRVSLSTLNGETACEVNLDGMVKSGEHITGRLGSGSGNLDVSAVNGDISLKLRSVIYTEPVQD